MKLKHFISCFWWCCWKNVYDIHVINLICYFLTISSYLSRIVNLHQSVHKMFHNDFRFGQLLNFIHEDSGSGEQEALSRIPNKFISICWMHFFDVNSGNGISIFRPFYCTFFFLKGATSKQIPRRWDDHFI